MTQSLESFLDEYIKNKELENQKSTGESALALYKDDAKKALGERLSGIEADYMKALPTYGRTAEQLGSAGLGGSGYSEYLKGLAYLDMQKQKKGAREDYEGALKDAYKSYADYLESSAKRQQSLLSDTVKAITSESILDFDAAYRFAVTRGLSESDAKAAAKTAVDEVSRAVKARVISTIVSEGLTREGAVSYALALGLSSEIAEELGVFAETLLNSKPKESESGKVGSIFGNYTPAN